MGRSTAVSVFGDPAVLMTRARRWLGRGTVVAVGLFTVLGIALWLWSQGYFAREKTVRNEHDRRPARRNSVESGSRDQAAGRLGEVRIDFDQQLAIGLSLVKAVSGDADDVLLAPGRIGPNETQYAFITPRAAGVVRSVTAHIGQDVKAGDLLATIDSPEVGQARLDLYTRLQTRDIARSQADWEEQVYNSTVELLERIRKGETPEQIHIALTDRAVGQNRERLVTAYAQYRLAQATMARTGSLRAEADHRKAISEGHGGV